MTVSVRIVLGVLAVSLAFGVWGTVILTDEAARRRAWAAGAIGDDGGTAERLGRLDRALSTRWPLSRLSRRLAAAGIGWSPLATAAGVLGVIVLILVAGQPLVGKITSALLAAMAPGAFFRWLKRRAGKRLENFISQLPELARIIANGNSAGLSMGRCLAMAGRELPDPAGSELRRVADRMDLGWGVDQALSDLAERMPSREIDVLIRTIVIQARTGGALSAALADIATALDERKELRREVATAILGSAVSGYAVMFIGAGAVILLNLMEPGMLDQMAGTLVGRIVLGGAAIFFVLGAVLMRLVSRVEI